MSSRKCLAIFSICLMLQKINGFLRLDPLVKTKVGLIRGLKATDGDYSKFLGIPYAKVEENNPFGPSVPYPVFEEEFEAIDDTAACPQSHNSGTQDCLKLFIHVPNSASSKNRLPVMVWIHGGAFVAGSAKENASGSKFLVRHDIIVVTLNYRLGIYGFMCLNEPEVPGNQGLKDQLLALRWVKENIEAFGGDADKITISGESAGSASVDLHLLYQQENLFNQVIIQSGTGLGPWVVIEPDVTAPVKIAAQLGFEGNNVEALKFLSSAQTEIVIAAADKIGIEFSPCVEKNVNVDTFITTDPHNAQAPNPNIRILIGSNEDELLYYYAYTDMTSVGNFFYNKLDTSFDFGDDLIRIEKIVRHYYIGDEEITNEVRSGVTDFDSDFLFQHPTERSAQKYLKNGAEVYRYLFSYMGERNALRRKYNLTFGGASHADELGYIFDLALFSDESITEEDMLMIDRITTLWSNFIKYGNPTPEITELLPVKWIPATEDTMHYLSIDSELTLKERPLKERMGFWDLFYEAFGKLQKNRVWV